jgi:MSHA biogenesis protein MshN
MSLINKMLQDLDARGKPAGSAMPADVRPAAAAARRLPAKQIAMAVSVLVIGAALATVFWLRRPRPVPAPVVTVVAPVVVKVPLPVATPVAVVAPPAALPVEKVAPAPVEPVARVAKDEPVVRVAKDEPVVKVAPAPRLARAIRVAEPERLPAPVAPPIVGGRDMNPAQRAEAQYRNALAALDEGRVTAALDGLEQALKLNPRHDAARQSLVALLIEAGRKDEAMQQLEQSLAADPAQPALAMLLARMQIERGTSGVATLLRTLPSVTGNADYHAFLAGVLQREGRHREAAEQYGAALRQAPEHGVWLMGLGISLQAEKRDREALAAFQRAKASGTLTAPLLAFVERKVQQLAP